MEQEWKLECMHAGCGYVEYYKFNPGTSKKCPKCGASMFLKKAR